jgi:hypothetical protein
MFAKSAVGPRTDRGPIPTTRTVAHVAHLLHGAWLRSQRPVGETVVPPTAKQTRKEDAVRLA